jgi:hypothetical protein
MVLCRKAAGPVVLALVLVAAHLANGRPAEPHPADGEPAGLFVLEERRAQEYARWGRLVLDSLRVKEEAVRDVIAGRLALREAAGRFAAAEAGRPSHTRTPPEQFPGATAAERRCRQVIHHVQERLDDDPDRRDAVVARLEAELRHDRAAQERGP